MPSMTKGKMIADLKSRFALPLFRRSSTSTTTTSAKSAASSVHSLPGRPRSTRSKTSLLLSKKPRRQSETLQEDDAETEHPQENVALPSPQVAATHATVSTAETQSVDPLSTPEPSPLSPRGTRDFEAHNDTSNVQLTIEEPTPDQKSLYSSQEAAEGVVTSSREGENKRLSLPRRQSLANNSEQKFIKTLLQTHNEHHHTTEAPDYFVGAAPTLSASMLHRKIWVKRPGASATLVQINEEDLVDDVRDMILKKYANSLGRSFDSPDVTLRIVPRDHSHRSTQGERTLGPEEPITRTLDAYFPGGQAVDEALIIDVPYRRTPRNSPRVPLPYYSVPEDSRPMETDQGYFPAVPIAQHSPHPGSTISVSGSASSGHHHSIAVLNTGQVPPLPSPGGRRHGHRPKFPRNNTSSPTTLTGNPPHGGISHTSSEGQPGQSRLTLPDNRVHTSAAPNPPPLPTPPLASIAAPQRAATPPPRVASPRPQKFKRPSQKKAKEPALPGSLLDGAVPPINVLIVEDNIINLRLLEAFMKRLKVRWSTAMNGRDAVSKWREGGFHLVLMDIQLPIMNGLDATKEIRRIESVNGVGVFALKSNTEKGKEKDQANNNDILKNTELFKSPVIIVALTASSLQSDRHEALAAGCNDFLTKPVNFVWLERKVMEWGCMQALIDFDGWRKWKDFSQNQQSKTASKSTASFVGAQKPSSFNPLSRTNSIPPQNALTALNEHGDSTNTVDTVDTIESMDSTTTGSSDTAAPPPKQIVTAPTPDLEPTVPTIPAPPAPVQRNNSLIMQRPSPLQTTTSASSPTRKVSPQEKDGQSNKSSPKDDRRRKRSSMGGLTGVKEEGEDPPASSSDRRGVGVGA